MQAMWKAAGVIFYNESPIVVVLSESMTPAFVRGDLLFLGLTSAPFEVGDIVVYKIKGHQIPIVHRVLEMHYEYNQLKRDQSRNYSMLTKGDYNPVDDRGLYNRGQLWIDAEDVMGRVYG
jgi:signal peptidase